MYDALELRIWAQDANAPAYIHWLTLLRYFYSGGISMQCYHAQHLMPPGNYWSLWYSKKYSLLWVFTYSAINALSDLADGVLCWCYSLLVKVTPWKPESVYLFVSYGILKAMHPETCSMQALRLCSEYLSAADSRITRFELIQEMSEKI